jgi:hypothetical protein
MKQSDVFRKNADNCSELAENASSAPALQRFKRMEAAWRALAHEQDWLDGDAVTHTVEDGKLVPKDRL